MQKRHGHSPRGGATPTYNAWATMLAKCRREGIHCDLSFRVFVGFLAAVGERPNNHMLARVDDQLGYVPGNVHWVRRWHGQTYTSEYFVWSGMIARCEDPNCPAYNNYGGRGITIDPAMRTFNGFFEVMGPRPTPAHTLERSDNNLGYAPGNVYWATRTEQGRNTRTNRVLTAHGRTQLLCEWAEELGIKAITISARIDRRGWSVEDALTSRKFRAGPFKRTADQILQIYNATGSHAEIAQAFQISSSEVCRIKSGQRWASLTKFGVLPRDVAP